MNIRIILRALGFLLLVEGVAMCLSLIIAIVYNEYDQSAFMLSSLITAAFGIVLLFFTRAAKKEISRHDGYIIVTSVWIVFSLFGSLPYIISGAIPNFTDAVFETISGFSTTGATILEDIESLPHGVLFWRSMTQWLGGMGIIVLSLAVLPVFGIGGMQLFMAEFPSPTPDRISPRIRQTAINLWRVYLIITLCETLFLWIAGMDLFDAVCHSFTTMASGGFSTKQASIAFWDSPLIHYIVILFMFLAGTNFALSYAVIRGDLKRLFFDEEFKFYNLFIIGFTVVIAFGLLFTSTYSGVEETFRNAFFQVVSIITTTGFITVDYLLWPPVFIILLFILFFTGGSAGSTSGGIKIMRIVLLLKISYYELRRIVHPQAVIPIKLNKQSIDNKIVTNIVAFIIFYFIIFTVSTVIFAIMDPEIDSAVGAVAASLGNIGPGLGNVGPSGTYAHISVIGKWFLSFLMLLGRLELFTVLVLLSPSFWRN